MLADVYGGGSGFVVLLPIVVLLGVGALIGSLWTHGREQRKMVAFPALGDTWGTFLRDARSGAPGLVGPVRPNSRKITPDRAIYARVSRSRSRVRCEGPDTADSTPRVAALARR